MTHLYHEHKYGADSLNNRMKTDREQIIAFSKKQAIPVVDTISSVDPMVLLNANSYQKGGWVLHMLRRKIGDSLFWKGLRSYYASYSGSNVSTQDLRRIFEQVSKQNLAGFFSQWIYTAGQPMLNIGWRYDKKTKMATVKIEQTQETLFDFPLAIAFQSGDKTMTHLLQVKDKVTTAKIPVTFVPVNIIPDPQTNLLFEAAVTMLK
jgi:aminopeptidase N